MRSAVERLFVFVLFRFLVIGIDEYVYGILSY